MASEGTMECCVGEVLEIVDAYRTADDAEKIAILLDAATRVAKRAGVPPMALVATMAASYVPRVVTT